MDMRSWWVDGGDGPNGHHGLSTLSLSHDEVLFFAVPRGDVSSKSSKAFKHFMDSMFLSSSTSERYRENLQRHPPLRTTDNHRLYDRDSIVTATASP